MAIRYTATHSFNSGGKDYGLGDVIDIEVATGPTWPADAFARRIANGHIVIDNESITEAALDDATAPAIPTGS